MCRIAKILISQQIGSQITNPQFAKKHWAAKRISAKMSHLRKSAVVSLNCPMSMGSVCICFLMVPVDVSWVVPVGSLAGP
jgi:hypothetical protein